MTNPNDPIGSATKPTNTRLLSDYDIIIGLTKREYFASVALQGYIAAGSTGMPDKEALAKYAVDAADALIEALNK
jgi:hypothetical protein